MNSPGLVAAARRPRLDVGELAEAVLHAVDAGADEPEAVRAVIAEAMRRRGGGSVQFQRMEART